ncbi:type IV pilin protein [Psychromonas sp. SA13A]|uniref:type IV pilin protein n=1 Tax=Psychromonas sp. SA13A TaxID=2686346 RepID=UPI00140C588B|nr:type IV pilin protein [Psychromonas sp. SA13A]
MKNKKGFTLIELLIVVAIVGILASIAYPSYQDSVTKSRRADAQGALQGLAQAMERHYTTEGTYTGAASAGSPTIFSTKSPIDGTVIYYNLLIASTTASTYIIGAEPTGVQAGDGVLLLRSTGARAWDENNSAAGSLATFITETTPSEQCWNC